MAGRVHRFGSVTLIVPDYCCMIRTPDGGMTFHLGAGGSIKLDAGKPAAPS
jgi:hypothetical protein